VLGASSGTWGMLSRFGTTADVMISAVITSNNRPVAALVSVKHADRESLSLGLNPALVEIIRRARAEIRRGKVFSLEQVKRELLAETAAPNEALQPPSRARRGRRSSKGPRAARG